MIFSTKFQGGYRFILVLGDSRHRVWRFNFSSCGLVFEIWGSGFGRFGIMACISGLKLQQVCSLELALHGSVLW